MRRLSILLLSLATAGLAPAKTGWKPLFNGKSFKPDWRFVGDSTFWTIDSKDSSIGGLSTTTNTPHSLLFTTKADYDEFTVKYAYRLKTGCSGFWFHTKGTTPDDVAGPQVEIKREGAELLEIGSIYTWPTPGWEPGAQHTRAYSIKTAPKVDEYQDVVLTVKKPYIYVNVNGSQALGETDPTLLAAGAKAAVNYATSTYAKNPGSFALQVHEGYAIDIRFRNIMLLQGCGDAASPNYDGAFVQGFPKQPAVYQDNGTCTGTSVAKSATGPDGSLARYLGSPVRMGGAVGLEVSFPGPHSLEIIGLDGRSVFSGSAPGANSYRLSSRIKPGIYFARLAAEGRTALRRILIP
ncbi:MAG: hypothetical protein JWO30_4289 [Fibrobacteres bacterium]|nr:hypothetical protein [Fibrobacterota bacterium]